MEAASSRVEAGRSLAEAADDAVEADVTKDDEEELELAKAKAQVELPDICRAMLLTIEWVRKEKGRGRILTMDLVRKG